MATTADERSDQGCEVSERPTRKTVERECLGVVRVTGHGAGEPRQRWRPGRPEQFEPAVRIVADLGDALRGDPSGRDTAG